MRSARRPRRSIPTTGCGRPSWTPGSTATSPATRRPRSDSWLRRNWPTASCSTAATRSRPPPTSCISWRATRRSASRHSRRKMRSQPSARPSARAMVGHSRSRPRPARGSRSRQRRWASRSWSNCHWWSSTSSAPAPRPGCRPRTSRRTSSRSCSGAIRTRRCRSWHRPPRANASISPSRPVGWPSST